MRIVIFFLFTVLMLPALAINKCEINGQISYRQGPCPAKAKTQYLINGKYISEEKLREYRHMPKTQTGLVNKQQAVSRQPLDSATGSPVQNQQADYEESTTGQHKSPQVNVPGVFDYVNPKLSEMDRKLEEHKKKLQQLQNAK